MTQDRITELLEDCVSVSTVQNCPFSKWEIDFIESVEEQFSERGSLTEKQTEILEKIWDKI